MSDQRVPHMRHLTALLLSSVFVSMFAFNVAAQSLQVIDLKHRTAQEVIPVLQPLLGPNDALTGSDYKLFVRANSATVTQLRNVLEQLDRQPRQLVVSVRRGTRSSVENDAAAAAVEMGNRGSSATVIATEDRGTQQGGGISSVQVIEGSSAFISTGQSIPLVTTVGAGGRNQWALSSTTYRDLHNGFLVTPRISGEFVTLEIEQQSQQPGANASTVQTQSLATQVRGSLNQWISLGEVNRSSTIEHSGILSRQYSTQSDATSVWVKVEER
ncbi:MAG: secretin N-terminal domain-containing protein [Povalibacter sp.]